MLDWSQMIFIGLSLGIVYMLMASGLTMIFGIMRQINNTHGVMYALAGLLGFNFVSKLGINLLLGMFLVAIVFGLLGIIIERIVFRPTRKEWLVGFLASTGIWFALEGLGWIYFGALPRNIPSPITGIMSIGGIVVSLERLFIIGIGVVVMGVLFFIVHKLPIGRQLRAVQEDSEAAALQGVNVDRVCSVGFFIGCACAAIAGFLIAIMFNMEVGSGTAALIKAFLIIAIGGLGSIPGSVLAGVILGLNDSIMGTLFGIQLAFSFAFILLLIILIVKPTGLVGRAGT
ncbi:MAG: branched-chain amino acid ABC transporter permease [Candidatus Hodarchaeota archaeon]